MYMYLHMLEVMSALAILSSRPLVLCSLDNSGRTRQNTRILPAHRIEHACTVHTCILKL